MSHAVLDLVYARFVGLLADRRLLRSDSDLEALDAVVAAAYPDYRAEFSREDGPGRTIGFIKRLPGELSA